MNLTIESKTTQKDMERTAVSASVSFDNAATPSRADLQAAIAKELKTEPALVFVTKIDTIFGANRATIDAFAFDNAAAIAKTQPAYMSKRNEIKAEEPAAEEAT